MKLIASPTSPYARKVRIALVEKRIDCEFVEDSPWSPGTKATLHNPLGKVPVLVLDDGTSLYDSRVIVEYLDTVSPVSRLIPEPSRQRIAVKRWEALADGICDAAVAVVLEGKRPAMQQSKEWIARQRDKIDRGVRELATELEDTHVRVETAKAFCSAEAPVGLAFLDCVLHLVQLIL